MPMQSAPTLKAASHVHVKLVSLEMAKTALHRATLVSSSMVKPVSTLTNVPQKWIIVTQMPHALTLKEVSLVNVKLASLEMVKTVIHHHAT
jgi:hypothetical protein